MATPESDYKGSEIDTHREILAVVTTTFYPKWYPGELNDSTDTDKVRGDLALHTLTKARDLGHYVLVVDDTGENSSFWSAIATLGVNAEAQNAKGMDPARQQAFAKAAEQEKVKIVAWIEPEKESMTDPACLWPAALTVLDGTYDLVVPARDEAGFATYPPYQVTYEKRANTRFNSILRKGGLLKPVDPDLDAWFGPRIFHKELLPYFTGKYDFGGVGETSALHDFYAHVKPGSYNSATFFPIIRALFENKKVGSVTIPYRHPAVQTANESDNPQMEAKRHAQYMNILTACLHYVRFLQEQDSRIRPH